MLEEAMQYKIPSRERLRAMMRQCTWKQGVDRGCQCQSGECKVLEVLERLGKDSSIVKLQGK